MQGEVYVYSPIGGMNMDAGIMPADLSGSTAPGIEEDELGTTVNLSWSFPGGIQNKTPSGVGWGYALVPGEKCTDDDIANWLAGNKRGRIDPSTTFTEEEILEASNPAMAEEINNLMTVYMNAVLINGDYNEMRETYQGCMIVGK